MGAQGQAQGTATGAEQDAFAYLLTIGIPQVVDNLIKLQTLAHARGLRAIEDGAGEILDGLLADVNRTAVEMAGVSEGLIIARMFSTAGGNRPITGTMEGHVRSEAGPLGSVRVGLLDELNRIVNPRGYGPFWRAQEYGTGSDEVASQVGRRIFGTFDPSGEPPDPAQRGLGQGHDLAFIPFGSAPGEGTITEELPGRHFLRDGATEAGVRYKRAMDAIQAKYVARIEAMLAELAAAKGRRTFTGRIEA